MSDLRAAAERVRRVHSGEDLVVVYDTLKDGPEWNPSFEAEAADKYRDDINMLARVYLTSHPPDGETEIDEAWLRAVGAIKEDHPQKWTFRRKDALDIGLWHVDDGWKVMLIHTPNAASCIIRGLKTRSDLRGLCEKLGISLKEEKASDI